MRKGVSMLANTMQLWCNLWCQRSLCLFISILELIVKRILDLQMHFLWRNWSKLPKDFLEVCSRITFFVKTGLSVVLHPTQIWQAIFESVLDKMLWNNTFFKNLWHLDILPTFHQHVNNMYNKVKRWVSNQQDSKMYEKNRGMRLACELDITK